MSSHRRIKLWSTIVFNEYTQRKNITIFCAKKPLRVRPGPSVCVCATMNSKYFRSLEISGLEPFFKSPRLEIDAYILVAQAEINGLLFPLAYF